MSYQCHFLLLAREGYMFLCLQIVLCMIGQVYYPDLQLQHAYESALKLAFSWNCKLISFVQPDGFAVRKQAKIIQMLVPLQHIFHKSFQRRD